ncbi:hypothetical protein CFC21_088866 [Triticum aestivum]|uniref:Pectin acetylesterase n=2 Tax=Triticum aestivum TaxID=4565 RepID=A0A3B6PQN0_WHEAT|nr:pectin acetylesterase 8-like isoform X1 [Triticum dicoccoides]XP_044413716.1 pectin acetylesterase 8-like isoform X1 [Triticum aestivum]KAF7085434.1 hypothetical protein CFC21_088866 [Triticum aestivum]
MGSGSKLRLWCSAFACALAFLGAHGDDDHLVDITYVESAVAKGAVCLDGSPPAYHLDPGSGSGVNSWLVHFEGGAWCNNAMTCLQRSRTPLGSSKEMAKRVAFTGILSNASGYNPDFYNWNKVKVRYCDGSSFTGDKEEVDPVSAYTSCLLLPALVPSTELHYRGARVWQAVIEDLLAKGMNKAENALISGCSAGGLTSILHCDRFHQLLPVDANVKCLSDAGFFINVKDITGANHAEAFFSDVVTTHGSAKNLPSSCTSKLPAGVCFFPQNEVQQIRTPLFILNAAYDSWQVRHILVPEGSDPGWRSCRDDITQCSAKQLETLQGFRDDFLEALGGSSSTGSRGLFVNSCFAHCQSEVQDIWFAPASPALGDRRIADAVGDWFYGRSGFQKTDCPYPCDSTCYTN